MPSAADTAAQYGYSVAFFNADPELKKLLNSAVAGNWTPAQFVAKLQATKWFKTNGEAARQIFALKTSDPATYTQRLNTAKMQVAELAWSMGARVPQKNMALISANALAFGWSEAQIKQALVPLIVADKDGIYYGGAAEVDRQLKSLMHAYGTTPSKNGLGAWVQKIASGVGTIDELRASLIKVQSSRFPGLKERLEGGETLEDIAAPYRDSYSRILEVPADSVSLTEDTLLHQAFSAVDRKGRPVPKTVWQFEQELRSDPRWTKTKNAQDQLVGTTRKVLADMGLVT